jgi:hypothetical protein
MRGNVHHTRSVLEQVSCGCPLIAQICNGATNFSRLFDDLLSCNYIASQ